MAFFPNTRLDRYLISGIVWPFIFGMVGFLIILSIDPLYFALNYLINDKVPFEIVAKWFFFRLISDDMIYAFPMSVLLSSLITFGQLSKDSEITAMLAGGISFYRITAPVLMVSLLMTLVAFSYNEYVVPMTNDIKRELKHGKIDKVPPPQVKSNVFVRDSKERFIYAARADSAAARLDDVIILEFSSGTFLKKRISARGAVYVDGIWRLYDVKVYDFLEKAGKKQKSMREMEISLAEEPSDFVRTNKRPKDMSAGELAEKIQFLHSRGVVDLRELLVELYTRFSVPFACVIFAFIGMLMGNSSQRSGSFIGFGISILVIFVYYVMMSLAKTAGKEGTITPMLAAWVQNILFFVYGLWLLSRVKS